MSPVSMQERVGQHGMPALVAELKTLTTTIGIAMPVVVERWTPELLQLVIAYYRGGIEEAVCVGSGIFEPVIATPLLLKLKALEARAKGGELGRRARGEAGCCWRETDRADVTDRPLEAVP